MWCARCKEPSTSLTWVHGDEGGLIEQVCDACLVGVQDPVSWLIDQVLKKYELAWESYQRFERGTLTGYASLSLSRDGKALRGAGAKPGVAVGLHLAGTKAPDRQLTYRIVIQCWTRNGGLSLQSIESPAATILEIDGLLRASIASCWKAFDEGRLDCASCSTSMTWDQVAGTHFASAFCATCWAKYKEDNSTRCLKCGSPHYSCVC